MDVTDICSAAQLLMQANAHHGLKEDRKQHLKIYQRKMRKGVFSAGDDEAEVHYSCPGRPLPTLCMSSSSTFLKKRKKWYGLRILCVSFVSDTRHAQGLDLAGLSLDEGGPVLKNEV
jgi:hypothetical protein